MSNEIVGLVQAKVGSAVRRAAFPAAFAMTAAVFVLFAVAGLFAAGFFWLEPEHGPVGAALICTAVALVIALIAALPLMFRRSKPPPPQDAMLPQFVSLMARSAPGLAPRQLVLTAAVVGVALVLSARGGGKK